MAQSVAHVFVDGDVLTHTQLNALNTNILDNGLAVISPLTGNFDCGNFALLNLATIRMTDAGAPTADGSLQRNGLAMEFYDGTRVQTIHGAIPFNSTIVGNVGGGEDDLMTLALGAGFFAVPGRMLQIDAGFHFAANANTKTLKVKLGASFHTINSATTAPNNVYAMTRLLVWRIGLNAQGLMGSLIMSTLADLMPTNDWFETEANALTLKFTGQSGANATDDIRQLFMAVALVR